MAILCEECKKYKPALDPQVNMGVYGYCRAWEYPFLLAIFKKDVSGAFMAPAECQLYEKGKGKAA